MKVRKNQSQRKIYCHSDIQNGLLKEYFRRIEREAIIDVNFIREYYNRIPVDREIMIEITAAISRMRFRLKKEQQN